jgi:hypothetical protein
LWQRSRKIIDTLSWFCGYIASEINRTEDNQKPHHPITKLSKTLITLGMEPFTERFKRKTGGSTLVLPDLFVFMKLSQLQLTKELPVFAQTYA